MTATGTGSGTRAVTPYRSALPPGRDGFVQLLHAEFTKLRTVSRWQLALLTGVVVTVVVALLSAGGSGLRGGGELGGDAPSGPGGEPVHDSFRFVHQPLTDDGSVTARVTGLAADKGPTPGWSKAGVMVKDGTRPGSTYAAMMLTQDHGVRLQSDFTHDVAGPGRSGDAPVWLRLTRSGSTLTGYESADGERWREVGSVALAGLPRIAEVGLFAAGPELVQTERGFGSVSVDAFPALVDAEFDHVSLAGGGGDGRGGGGGWRSEDVGLAPAGPGTSGRDGDTFALTGSGNIAPRVPDIDLARQSLAGAQIGLIAFAALGVVFITAEYRRGMIRTTLAAGPRRGRLLVAKAAVLGAVTFAAGLVAAAVSFLLGQQVLRANGHKPPVFPELSLADGPVLRAVVGTAAVLALAAVFGLALGALLRHTAAAIALVVVLMVLPLILGSGLPVATARMLLLLTPAAGFSIQQTLPDYDHVDTMCLPEDGCFTQGPWPGLWVLCGYAVIVLALAVRRLRRGDA